jgi:hypothetical protein
MKYLELKCSSSGSIKIIGLTISALGPLKKMSSVTKKNQKSYFHLTPNFTESETTKMFTENQSSKQTKNDRVIEVLGSFENSSRFSQKSICCANIFRNLANVEAIRPILFLNGQQCHPIIY